MQSISQHTDILLASENFLNGANSAKSDKLRLHLSFGTDAINYILVAAGCPESFRSYIDCLIGLSEGRHEFEASDKDIAARVRPDEQSPGRAAGKQWVKRKYGEFAAWQAKSGFNFMECRRGYIERHTDHHGKKSRIFHLSRYRLHILTLAAKVVSEAQRSALRWEANPLREIELAACEEVQRISVRSGVAFPGRASSQMPWFVEIRPYLKTAETFLDKTAKAIPEGAELYGQYEDLVKKIHRQAARLLEMIQK